MSKYDFSGIEDNDEDKQEPESKSSSKYDFGEIQEKEKERQKKKEEEKKYIGQEYDGNDISKEDDPRGDFRITRCCGNCKYFYYTGVKSRRGYCKLTNIKHMNIGAYHKTDLEPTAKKYGWPRTHTTCVCDDHEFRGQQTSINRVGDWVRRKFDYRGKQILDEEK